MKSVSGCGDIPYGMGFCFQSFHPFLNTWEDNPWQCIPFIRVQAKIMNLSRRNDDKYSATHTVFSLYNIMEVPHRITRRARPCSRNTVRMGPTNHVLSGSPSDHYPKLRRQNRSISRKTPSASTSLHWIAPRNVYAGNFTKCVAVYHSRHVWIRKCNQYRLCNARYK